MKIPEIAGKRTSDWKTASGPATDSSATPPARYSIVRHTSALTARSTSRSALPPVHYFADIVDTPILLLTRALDGIRDDNSIKYENESEPPLFEMGKSFGGTAGNFGNGAIHSVGAGYHLGPADIEACTAIGIFLSAGLTPVTANTWRGF